MAALRTARVDVRGGEYVVHVTGFAPEAVEVDVAGRVVTLAERFELPADANAARVTATFRHGEIELHAPRHIGAPSPAPARRVPLEHRFAMNADASGV
jgi:hypothetical protein